MNVRIKPLEWKLSIEGYASGQWFASSLLGEYYTYMHTPTGRAWLKGPDGLADFHDTIDLAKAAAQADYERRIRSALTPASTNGGETSLAEDWVLVPREPTTDMLVAYHNAKHEGPKPTMIPDLWRALLGAAPRPAPTVPGEVTDADYLVWSNEHRGWWRANSCGYAKSILEAGRYTRAEAIDIADKSRNGWKLDQRPDEIAVAIADLPAPIRAALTAGDNSNG